MKTMLMLSVCFVGLLIVTLSQVSGELQPIEVINNFELSFRTFPNGFVFDRSRNQSIFNDHQCQITVFDADFQEIGKSNLVNQVESEGPGSRTVCLGIAFHEPMDIIWRLERVFPGVSTNLVGYNRTALLNGISDQLVWRIYTLPKSLISLTVLPSGLVCVLDIYGVVRLLKPSQKNASFYQLTRVVSFPYSHRSSIAYHPAGFLVVATTNQPLTRINPANGHTLRLEQNILPFDESSKIPSVVVLGDGRMLLISSAFIGVLDADDDWTIPRSRAVLFWQKNPNERVILLSALAKNDLELNVLYQATGKSTQYRLETISFHPIKRSLSKTGSFSDWLRKKSLRRSMQITRE